MIAPCMYGADENGEWYGPCVYLLPENELGQRLCGKYDEIVEKEKSVEYEMRMFGNKSGCFRPFSNTRRNVVLLNISNGRKQCGKSEMVTT